MFFRFVGCGWRKIYNKVASFAINLWQQWTEPWCHNYPVSNCQKTRGSYLFFLLHISVVDPEIGCGKGQKHENCTTAFGGLLFRELLLQERRMRQDPFGTHWISYCILKHVYIFNLNANKDFHIHHVYLLGLQINKTIHIRVGIKIEILNYVLIICRLKSARSKYSTKPGWLHPINY